TQHMYYMQEQISEMKQVGFSDSDVLRSMAIVNIFETGKPFGEFAACVVLNDGAGISYGINQFTHRSGSLAAVVEKYLELGGNVGRTVLENALPMLWRSDPRFVRALAANERCKKALRAAAITREMRQAQLHVALERYLKPAIEAASGSGFILPLSLAVIYDSLTHGSYERIRDRVSVTPLGVQSRTAEAFTLAEKAWIAEYVRKRDAWLASVPRLNATRYRTRFFLNQIMLGNWDLKLPLTVNGFWLKDEHIRSLTAFADGFHDTAAGPKTAPHQKDQNLQSPPFQPQVPSTIPQAQPPLDAVEERFDHIAERFDRIDRIITGIATRTDRAKSLWTTILGTLWQTAWAMFGTIAGLPLGVWLAVAVIAALLMLFYLYRQIALGKIRESGTHVSRMQ
ncbi:MAG: chitosanase, partial [Pyrinomonadaceae bacterium]